MSSVLYTGTFSIPIEALSSERSIEHHPEPQTTHQNTQQSTQTLTEEAEQTSEYSVGGGVVNPSAASTAPTVVSAVSTAFSPLQDLLFNDTYGSETFVPPRRARTAGDTGGWYSMIRPRQQQSAYRLPTVSRYLSNKHFEMVKRLSETLECPVCLDDIDCQKCFKLFICCLLYTSDAADD